MQQKRWDATSEIRLQKKKCYFHLVCSLSSSGLLALREASCHVVTYVVRKTEGKNMWQTPEGGLWPLASDNVRPLFHKTVRN